VWDESDIHTKYPNQEFLFYANYTNRTSGSPISGAGIYCNITFEDSKTFTMSFNSSSGLYQLNRTFLTGGNYTWNVSCDGSATGYEPLNATDIAVIVSDTQPPVIGLINPINMSWNNSVGMIFVYNAHDNAGIANCSLVINNRINMTNNSVIENTNNIFNVENIGEGTYSWTVNCTDVNNNIGTNLSYRILTIDRTEPSITLIKPPNASTKSGNVEFNFSATDNLDTNMRCNLTIDGAVNVSYINAENGSITSVSVSGLSETVHIWNVTCWDNASNTNTSQTWTFSSDVTAPNAEIIELSPNVTGYGQNITILANITDPEGVPTARVNVTYPNGSTAWIDMDNSSGIFTAVFNDSWYLGIYSFNIYYVDGVGNENVTENSSFKIEVNASLNVKTTKDTYGASRAVNLTEVDYSNWFNTSFMARIPINITENTGNDIKDYQINLTLDTQSLIQQGKMKPDCSDIRIADVNKKRYHHWIEGPCNSQNTVIWTKVNLTGGQVNKFYIYYGNKLAEDLSDHNNTFTVIGEVGFEEISTPWETINFSRSYKSPVVVAQYLSYAGHDAAITRFNTTSTGIRIRIVEDMESDDNHINENVSWMVIEEGIWYFEDGTKIEAHKYNTTSTCGNSISTDIFDTLYYNHTYTNVTVFAQPMSAFDMSDDYNGRWLKTRMRNKGLESFEVAFEMEKTDSNSQRQTPETMAWIAVETGRNGSNNNVRYEVYSNTFQDDGPGTGAIEGISDAGAILEAVEKKSGG